MTTLKANRRFPNPITVTDDPKSHTLALQQVIEALNVGQRRTREINSSYVRVSELVDMGLIEVVGNQLKLTNTGAAAAGGSTTLAGLTDVDLTGIGDGDVLVYDSGTSTWYAVPNALANLTDVDATGVADGDVLTYDSGTSKWLPAAPSAGGGLTDLYDQTLNNLADVAFYMPNDGDVLTYNAALGVWESAPANGGALEFVGKTVVAGAAATNITVSGLDLDTDECYLVQIELLGAAAGAATVNAYFNGDTTATNYERSLNAVTGDNSAIGGLNDAQPALWSGYLRRVVSGRAVLHLQGGRMISTTAIDYSSTVIWDTSANVTSLTISSSVASQIAVGSAVRVWRLTETPASSGTGVLGAEVTRSTDLAVASATMTDLDLVTEVVDTGGFWDSGTPERFTAVGAGFYSLTINFRFSALEVGGIVVGLNQAPTVTVATEYAATSLNGSYAHTFSWSGYLEDGDYLHMGVYTSSASVVNGAARPVRACFLKLS